MSYTISASLRGDAPIAVIGVGGTGSFVAESLCRILPTNQPLILVDFDRVEDHNLGRQNFYQGEVGMFKSQALAERLARRYGREVVYSIYPFDKDVLNESWGRQGTRLFGGLIIGCVDNAAARIEIANTLRTNRTCWWLDAGNGENSGQILLGSVLDKESMSYSIDPDKMVIRAMPAPSVQQPELLIPVPKPERPMNCAQRVAANEQSPTINQFMSILVVDMVRRLLADKLNWMAVYADLENGCLNPVIVSPESVTLPFGISLKSATKSLELRRI